MFDRFIRETRGVGGRDNSFNHSLIQLFLVSIQGKANKDKWGNIFIVTKER